MKTKEESPQLYELARPVPAKFIKPAPQGKYGTYIPHFVIEQVLLAIVGPVTTHHVETLYGHVPQQVNRDTGEVTHAGLVDAVCGVVLSMTVTVDGEDVTVTEAGGCDAGAYEWNNGERMKKAMSDAYKRCAMRLGVGLHLWCKSPEEHFLPAALRLAEEHAAGIEDQDEVVVGGEDVDDEG